MKTPFTYLNPLPSLLAFRPGWRGSITAFLVNLCFISQSQAQNIIWDRTIGGSSGDVLAALKQTQDGGYILGGTSSSDKSGDKSENSGDVLGPSNFVKSDFWIVKTDANGKKIWDKTIGGSGRDELAVVQQTRDGGYILGGSSLSDKSGDKSQDNKGSKESRDYWVVKLRADGSKEWDKTFGGGQDDELKSLQQTSDGGFILGGGSFSGKGGDKSEDRKGTINYNDFWIIKIDSTGIKEWDKTIGGTNYDGLKTLQQTPDNGYLLGGYSFSNIGGDKTEAGRGGSDYWLVKVDVSGKKVWDRTIGGSNSDDLVSAQQTQDGNIILGGHSESGIGGDKTEANKRNSDYWIVKLKADRTKEWDKTIGGNSIDELKALRLTPDGGYLLGGKSWSGISGDKSEASIGYDDYWVVKLNAAGNFVGDQTIQGNSIDELSSLELNADGSIILGGSSASKNQYDKTQDSKGEFDYWIVKLDGTFLKNQTIAFPAFLNQEVGRTLTLSAKASSGLPITYRLLSGPAILKGNQLKLTGPGTVRVEAFQAGNELYKSVEVTQSLVATLTGKQWQKSFGSNKADLLSQTVATPDGGYLLGGTSTATATGDKSQTGPGKTDYWIVKTDKQGNKLWDKTYGGSEAEKLTAVLPAPDGGYLLGGSSASNASGDKTQASKGKADFWLVKIDSTGKLIWNQSFGGADADSLTSLLATPDGGYLLGGSSASNVSGDKTQAGKGKSDYWIVKVNGTGKKLWDKTYGGNQADQLATIVLRPGGGYLLGGTSESEVSGDKSQAPRGLADYWVIRINEQGTKIWDKTYGGIKRTSPYEEGTSGASMLASMVATPDGNYLLGGSSNASKGGEKTQDRRGPYNNNGFYIKDFWVVKINDQGAKLWDKTYGGQLESATGLFDRTIGSSFLRTIVPLANGNFLLGGTSDSNTGGDKSEDNRYIIDLNSDGPDWDPAPDAFAVFNDYWLLEIDAQGTKVEDRTLGGNKDDALKSVVLTANGNILLAGTSKSDNTGDKSIANKGEADYWLVAVSINKKPDPNPTLLAWDMRYGSYASDNLTSIIKTTDGGYLSGGYSAYYSPGGDKTQNNQGKIDYWIVKSDKNGKKLWDKTFGGTADDYLNRVIQTQDGGYLLAGSSLSGVGGDKTQASKGNRDYWIIKTDKQGNKQWDKTFGGSGLDELQKVIQLTSGEYVLGGSSNSPVSGDKTQAAQGGRDFWLIKISSTGTIIWDKSYGGDKDETLGSFIETADKGFLLGGTSLSGKTGDKTQVSQGASDYWAVKTDKNGNLVWEKSFGGSSTDEAYSIGTSANNNYFIAGTSASGKSGDKSQESKGEKDYWLISLDQNGNKLWDKSFGGNRDDELRASTFTSQGQYVLAGTSHSGISGDKTRISQGESDYWIVTVNADGNKVQDQRYGGSGQDELRTVTQTRDGGMLLGGRSTSGVSGDRTQPSWNETDYWLVKVAPDNTPMLAAREATPVVAEASEKAKLVTLSVYPNPALDKATITFTLPQTQPATVRVLDGQGQEIKTLFQDEVKANQTYRVEWKTDKQVSGMYLLQLQTPTQKNTEKVLLNK